MKKTNKLAIKTKLFLKKLGCPRFLHHFGPKKYEIAEHIVALQLKEVCRMSFRRLTNFLKLIGLRCPTYSALCKSRKRIPKWIWDKMLALSASLSSINVAIDSTGISMQNPSAHFIKRIDRKDSIKDFVKLSAFYDIDNRKFLAIKVRRKRRHDVLDFPELFRKQNSFKNFYADTAYDSEKIHESCFDNGIQTFIKPRINVRKGFYRRKQMKNYSDEKYHQRSLIETGFSVLKRKYGGHTLTKSLRNIQAELYLRAIASNLNLRS